MSGAISTPKSLFNNHNEPLQRRSMSVSLVMLKYKAIVQSPAHRENTKLNEAPLKLPELHLPTCSPSIKETKQSHAATSPKGNRKVPYSLKTNYRRSPTHKPTIKIDTPSALLSFEDALRISMESEKASQKSTYYKTCSLPISPELNLLRNILKNGQATEPKRRLSSKSIMEDSSPPEESSFSKPHSNPTKSILKSPSSKFQENSPGHPKPGRTFKISQKVVRFPDEQS